MTLGNRINDQVANHDVVARGAVYASPDNSHGMRTVRSLAHDGCRCAGIHFRFLPVAIETRSGLPKSGPSILQFLTPKNKYSVGSSACVDQFNDWRSVTARPQITALGPLADEPHQFVIYLANCSIQLYVSLIETRSEYIHWLWYQKCEGKDEAYLYSHERTSKERCTLCFGTAMAHFELGIPREIIKSGRCLSTSRGRHDIGAW